jgi:hypothetical protein
MYVQLFSSLCAIMRVEVELTLGKRIPPAMVSQHPLPKCNIRMRPYPWFTLIRFIDPMALIESLRLNKGEQQDAAEFSKLFLEMITNELLKQKDLRLRGLTKELVRIKHHL